MDTERIPGGGVHETPDEGEGGRASKELDSVELFVADLNALRHAGGDVGVKALGRRMGLSHGSVHRALSSPPKLPSTYVLQRMIDYWQPDRSAQWAERHRRLMDAATAGPRMDSEGAVTVAGLGSALSEPSALPSSSRTTPADPSSARPSPADRSPARTWAARDWPPRHWPAHLRGVRVLL